ncbi:unnamed protein product [Phytomonas sp. Hart1]|nr:unnamed protein product [Phytomonas sp. Hart1]|eukprot:CCW67422.1 unnamed protein product [Phytomonas sp. isolate Hart1]
MIKPFNGRQLWYALLVVVILLGFHSHDVLATEKGTPIAFQAEVSKMLDILVNSLYTNRQVFLRELISNGSDALSKIRMVYLKSRKEPVNASGDEPTMDIRIHFNEEMKQLIIQDGGVGMTEEELDKNLGSLGSSGTRSFLEKIQNASKDSSNNLIGQFGVGFYSVFLVGDRVSVASKSDDSDVQYVWESSGDGKYFLYEDPRGNTLGRGTEIVIDLKPDALEFLKPDFIKEVIQQYSEFIDYPIYVAEVVEVEKPSPSTNTTEDSENETTEENEEKKVEEDEEKEVEKIREVRWTHANTNKPIWTRPLGNVTDDEYIDFYQATFKDSKQPIYYSHFKAEGEVDFDSILFIPHEDDLTSILEETESNSIKLYIRRVFITDEFRELLPRYFGFVKGVVDSNDLPLNVSRENLQENRILRVIRKKLVRKIFSMINDIATHEENFKKYTNTTDAAKAESPERRGTKKLEKPMYSHFWEKFGLNIRYGIINDAVNRGRLSKLLRFKSSQSENEFISLQTYVDRMKKDQKGIYFLTGDSIERIKQSPVLQDALDRKYEVLYMTDAVDEYFVRHMTDFAGKKLLNLVHNEVRMGDVDEDRRAIAKKRTEMYSDFLTHLSTFLEPGEVSKVILTHRHTTEAFIVSSNQHHITARMSNIIRSQAIGLDREIPKVRRVVEVNYRHPLVNELYQRFIIDKDDEMAKDIAWVLYEIASMRAEFPVSNISMHAKRIDRLLRGGADIGLDEELLPEDDDKYLEIVKEERAALAAKKNETQATAKKKMVDEPPTTEEESSKPSLKVEVKEENSEDNEDL